MILLWWRKEADVCICGHTRHDHARWFFNTKCRVYYNLGVFVCNCRRFAYDPNGVEDESDTV